MNELGLKVLLFTLIGYAVVVIIQFICSSPKVLKKMNPNFGEFKIKALSEEHSKNAVYDLMILSIGSMCYLILKTM